MNAKIDSSKIMGELKVLIVGNNPIELSRVFENLHNVQGNKLVTEIAFDFKSIRERLLTFKPNFIFIDDNIGKVELKNMIGSLVTRNRTKNIPITVLKNSNYQESVTSGVMNFLLKENLTPDALYKSFIYSLQFIKTHQYLLESYRTRKGQLKRFLKS